MGRKKNINSSIKSEESDSRDSSPKRKDKGSEKKEKEIGGLDDFDLDNIDKEETQKENKQQVMLFKDFYEVDYQSIHNYHKKVVLHNLPATANEDEIKQYFFTFLVTLNPENKTTSPIISLEKWEKEGFWLIELSSQDNIEILINIDQTEWRGFKMRIEKPAVFFRKYNSTKGENCIHRILKKDVNTGDLIDVENRLFLSGFPKSASEKEIRQVVESFGEVKYINIIKDYYNPGSSRGFGFF
mmetsp:Transcript_10009/g.10324  ORF Transcript_10009/g.10324 Transcript_10009/m.10324 type:complete len:242 (+) Transcript_10009:8-733(+)